MVFLLMWLLWVIAAMGFISGTIWLGILGGIIALVLTIAVLVKYQENLYLREELKKRLVDVRNDTINLYQKYLLVHRTHSDTDQKDRGSVEAITKNIGQSLSWLWPGSLYPAGVLAVPTTDQESVKELNSLYRELREAINEYNEKMLELRKKTLSIIWHYVYSCKDFVYLDKIAFVKTAEKMVQDANDNF